MPVLVEVLDKQRLACLVKCHKLVFARPVKHLLLVIVTRALTMVTC